MNPALPRESMETISEYERYMMENRNGSITAESLALIRAKESRRPPGERICYDPYALRFVNPELLEILSRMPPEKMKAMQDDYEIRFPGHKNSLYTRVRFFDDKTAACIRDGCTQVVIIGAGYDTRAYRIEGIARTKIFELDLPDIQERKKATIKGIFGSLPDHVTYIPVDLSTTPLETVLMASGLDSCRKTLFLMEGLICYIPPEKAKILFSSLISLSAPGSVVLF
ncbi:MAG: SAM-dependent methyltransferase, partial [Methanospirillum sp.]|nr:SAM-dependent methyltransferase [Methanospirillum sp.]